MPIIISPKGNNQRSIALAYNPVFYCKTKYINIQHYYIRNKVGTKRIKLSYIPINKIIANSLTKALTNVKFHKFIEQMRIT